MAARFEQFEARRAETRAAISRVIERAKPPSWWRSHAEYCREYATAYEARAEFWNEVIDHVIEHEPGINQVVFEALLDAYHGCLEQAQTARRDGRDDARFWQEQAYRTYADNITAAKPTTRPTVTPAPYLAA